MWKYLFIIGIFVPGVLSGQTSPPAEDIVDGPPGITMEEGRKLWKGIFDIPRLIHTRAVIQIAKDQRLLDRCELFMEVNSIKVLNIGYIESDEFWPAKGKKNQENWLVRESVAAQLTGRIIFFPEVDGDKIIGYRIDLTLEGESEEVYSLLNVSGEEMEAIVEESQAEHLGEQLVEKPSHARSQVVSAMIKALDGVEGLKHQKHNSEERGKSLADIKKQLIKEGLEDMKLNLSRFAEAHQAGSPNSMDILNICFHEREYALDRLLQNANNCIEKLDDVLVAIEADEIRREDLSKIAQQLNEKESPYYNILDEGEKEEVRLIICSHLIEGIEQKRPKLVAIEQITDDQFAAGIDDDKLKITYSIKTTEKYPLQYAKLEVYKNDGTLAYVSSETIEIGEDKTFHWDGQMNQNIQEDEEKAYLRSDESPFSVKIIASANENFADPFQAETQASVNPFVDAFLENYEIAKHIEASSDLGKFEYYQQLATFMYDEVTSDQTDEQVLRNFTNALDYLGNQVNERTFLGRKVIVHDNYWVYLRDIENNLSSSYVNHPDYTMGGFSIRFQRNSTDQVSNHAYGMALDVNWQRNPYLSKGQLYFLQLLTDFKFFQNPSNPEDSKVAHDKLVAFGYQQADISSIKAGFEYLNQNILKTENFERLLNETLGDYHSATSSFSQLVNRNTNLRNEVHFFNQKTPQEIAEIERQLFDELPAEADALWETVKAIKSTKEISQLYDLYKKGYLKAFLLDKHKTNENATLLTALNNLEVLFGFETAIASLKEACVPPANGDYTYWLTNVNITQPQSVPEASNYQSVGTFIESRKADYISIFGSSSSYSGIISLLNGNATSLAQNGFMLMSAEFAREFLDTGNGDIDWGGNWKGLKDFMHLEFVADDRFGISN